MARTKASVGAKISVGKSSKARCCAAPPAASSTSSGSTDRPSKSSGGGNPVCPRETPKWQRPITNFFIGKEGNRGDEIAAGSSKPKKRNVIESDDETENLQVDSAEKPKNTVLDESIELQPLSGEDSHKIEEYYAQNGEGAIKNGETRVQNGEKSVHNGETSVQNGEKSVHGEKSVQNGEDSAQNGCDPKNKGKGKGKRTNKENIDGNIERRKSMKRDLEEINFGVENEQVNKKIKVN